MFDGVGIKQQIECPRILKVLDPKTAYVSTQKDVTEKCHIANTCVYLTDTL
jgi:hypothetical protein